MSQPYPPVEPSPDPYERFPLYTPPAYPPPAAPPVPAAPSAALVPAPALYVPAAAFESRLTLTDQQEPNPTVTVVAWVVVLLTGFYMLPWAIAATRGKANQWSIFVGNLLLGWTLIGWIIALVKACGAHRPVHQGPPAIAAGPVQVAQPGWYPSPDGRGVRYFDGTRWTAQRPG